MKARKRVAVVGLITSLALVAAACGSDEEASIATNAPVVTDAPDATDAPEATESTDAPEVTDGEPAIRVYKYLKRGG